MKKLIKYITISTIIAASFISCSSDASEGMLAAIANSQAEVSYTIKKSSYNTTRNYFVSVESDGIWKANYLSAENNADLNIQDNVKRTFFENSGKDNLTSIQSIYTNGDRSYVFYIDTTDMNNQIGKIKYFNNAYEDSDFTPVLTSDDVTGDIKNMTEDGHIISVDTDTANETSTLYFYSVSWGTASASTTVTEEFTIDNIYNADYESSRYNNYALVKDVSSAPTKDTVYKGIIISLTDNDGDNDSYSAADDYYYFEYATLPSTVHEFNINDSDDDGVAEAVVAANYIGPNTFMVLTSDGDCYQDDITQDTTALTEIWSNEDNSDKFAYHLPTISYYEDPVSYIIAMDSYDYVYIYATNDTDDRTSTVSEENVAYTDDLNNASNIIYMQYIRSDSGIDTYRVATMDNGFYTIKIDTANISDEDSTEHNSTEGFTDISF